VLEVNIFGLIRKVANWILERCEDLNFFIYGKIGFYIPVNVQA
jgi:hypothetical protein